MEEMNEELRKQLGLLARGIVELNRAAAQALGFVKTVEYQGISFNVSRRFVIADLTPLAFFHLIEPIGQTPDSDPGPDRAACIEAAVIALHDRLLPLLTCTHQWINLKRADDERVLITMAVAGPHTGPRPMICKVCTAYALESSLPVIGRSFG